MQIEDIRRAFPHTANTIYLNHAATSPLSVPVMHGIQAYLEERHRSHIENFGSFQTVIRKTREELADLLGVTPDRVDFSSNTSSALNIVARGLKWHPGDRILIPGCEFPANVYPFMNLKKEGVRIDFLPHREGTFEPDRLAEAIRPDTRLVTLSWVQFLSGFRADIQAIGAVCKEKNVLFCVDGIQGLGAVTLSDPLDVCNVDFFASATHKWLMGAQGLAFFYCSRRLQEQLDPPQPGWLHGPVDWDRFLDYGLRFHDDVKRFRSGTMNHVGIAALHAALGFYKKADPVACEQTVLRLARRLAEGLKKEGFQRYGPSDTRSGIVTCKHADPEAAAGRLEANGIQISIRNRMLRFSPTWYNSEAEIEKTLAVLTSGRR